MLPLNKKKVATKTGIFNKPCQPDPSISGTTAITTRATKSLQFSNLVLDHSRLLV